MGQAKFQIVHDFGEGTDGAGLWSEVVFDAQGNLYGGTSGGGEYGLGIAYELSPNGDGTWAEVILHSFPAFPGDGAEMNGSLIVDAVGNLFGATTNGGASNYGTVFELTRDGGGAWTESVLYDFVSNSVLGDPLAGLARDAAGNLYGTANGGVFQVSLGGGGTWTESNICIAGPCAGSNYEQMSLTSQGYLYGGARDGGLHDLGAVYALRQKAHGWQEYVLYNFGGYPEDGQTLSLGALAYDGKDNIYGSTFGGGRYSCGGGGCGTIYRLRWDGAHHQWKETILYNFDNVNQGTNPGGGVILGPDGKLYGTTINGGTGCGCGVVYRLSPNKNGSWTYTVLHNFEGIDGAQPDANLTIGPDGNLYGTTATGGPYGGGVVFEITP
jgi:uncharacterized repeat protein (TIGR03803 family)